MSKRKVSGCVLTKDFWTPSPSPLFVGIWASYAQADLTKMPGTFGIMCR